MYIIIFKYHDIQYYVYDNVYDLIDEIDILYELYGDDPEFSYEVFKGEPWDYTLN